MAIYYINPHTTVNGTGTWASPWSLSSSTRTGLVSGDEIRIMGVALTSLLTATTYTATFTTAASITLTSGGGLGADFVAGNVLYFPQYDTFAKITSSASNILTIYSNGMMPIYNSAAGAGTIQVRKVNTTSYPVGSTSSYYIGGGTTSNNLTITDGWINETTRVTDGTVKTLFNSSTTSSVSCFFDSTLSGIYGYTINLPNTCVLNSNATTSLGYISSFVYGSNSTFVVGQIFSQYVSGGTAFGTSSAPVYNVSFNITHASGSVLGVSYGKNISFTATNVSTYCADALFAPTALTAINNCTVNFNYIISATYMWNSGGLAYLTNVYNTTLNFNGMLDIYGATGLSNIISGYGNLTVNLDPTNFTIKYNKRTATQTFVTYGVQSSQQLSAGNVYYIPTLNTTGITYMSFKYYMSTSAISQLNASKSERIPNTTVVDFPTSTSAPIPFGTSFNNNTLLTYKDGTDPIEILGINGSGYNTAASYAVFPIVQKDATIYRTSAPSLKSYLQTRNAAFWTSAGGLQKTSTAAKSIKIPVVSGVSVTVSGYIRTDDVSYVNGDCDVAIMFLGVQVATQAMTAACINAWEQFSLTFTPSQTGEAILLWEMYYANGAKSYWLDDLTIT